MNRSLISASLGGLVILILVLAWVVLMPVGRPSRRVSNILLCKRDEAQLGVAIKDYQKKYAIHPTGTTAEIIRLLRGDNPGRWQFVVIDPKRLTSSGEYLDHWGTPYSIVFYSTNAFRISSAGKDTTPGNEDDIVFDGAKEDLLKP